MSITWIEQYVKNHPQKNIWEYIQENPKKTEDLLGISYSEVQEIIEQVQSDYEKDKTIIDNKQIKLFEKYISLEAQIFLTLIQLEQDLSFFLLGRLFQISRSQTKKVFRCWQSKIPSSVLEIILNLDNLESAGEIEEELICDSSSEPESLLGEDVETTPCYSSRLPAPTHGESYAQQNQISYYPETMEESYDGLDQCLVQSSDGQISGSLSDYRWDSNSLPLSNRTKRLPHNGLFIRRNNDFGTRLTVGIKDLIEQGTLPDQTDIRFDDFVALNTERVPSPQQDNSLAVSYGITNIPLTQKRDERATHYLEIALKASDAAPKELPKNELPPVNYIFVVDVSGSMSGEKIDNVKASIRELFEKLREDDVIGIIEFDDRPNTLLQATPVNRIDKYQFSEIISNLRPKGATDINLAISYGIDEINRRGNNKSLNHIYLFSDGSPNSGETDWIKIRQNIDNKARDARTRGDFRLSTFAFGSDAYTKELDALAGLTGGKSTFVIDPNDIKNSLEEELNRREHLAAINVQMQIEIDSEIDILYLYGHDEVTDPARKAAILRDVEDAKDKAEEELGVEAAEDLVTKEEGIRIFVPDLAIGETYWVVFELAIPEDKKEIPVGKATIQYVDTFVRENQKPELELSIPGNLPDDLVVEHALALWTSEVAFWTLDDLYENDLDTAKKRIENHVSILESANKDLNSDDVRDDAISLRKLASLSSNLGMAIMASDVSGGYRGVSTQTYPVMFALNTFGRVTNGFNRLNY